MAYSNFTLKKLVSNFSLEIKEADLFSNLTEIEPSKWLSHALAISKKMPLNTEKARNELIVSPFLSELKEKTILFQFIRPLS